MNPNEPRGGQGLQANLYPRLFFKWGGGTLQSKFCKQMVCSSKKFFQTLLWFLGFQLLVLLVFKQRLFNSSWFHATKEYYYSYIVFALFQFQRFVLRFFEKGPQNNSFFSWNIGYICWSICNFGLNISLFNVSSIFCVSVITTVVVLLLNAG